MGGLYSPKKLDLYGCDITKCIFYENGWYFKVLDAMEGWSNTTPIDIFEREINK